MMRLHYLAAMIIAGGILSAGIVSAQSYPHKTIRFIMPYPVGGSIDIAGRMVMQKLAENLGQQVVVDNRTGAGGIVGTETAARAAPDGYTLVMGGNGTLALSPHLQRALPYDPVRDFAPVTLLVITPYVLVVNPALQANSVKELIALARSRPDRINYASGGSGSAPHLAAEIFKTMADVRLVHVPYKGSTPGITDVISGQVQLIFTGIPSVLTHIKSGRLRPLAVTSAARAAALPELVTRLNSEIVKVLRTPAIRERFAVEGVEPVGSTPAQFASHIKLELVKWGKVIKDAGIRAD
jgi:tripartite-type tricarboxylate transporter receptor subunit TctC